MQELILRRRKQLDWLLGLVMCLCITSCGTFIERGGSGTETAVDAVDDTVVRTEPRSRYGNPETYEVFGKTYKTLKSSSGFQERGIASWYGKKFHGRRTSSGETYDMYKMTAAHKHLPLPSYVTVKNLENGRSVVVKVNDRGPFHGNRIIDLSYAAAVKLGVANKGTGFVEVIAMGAPSEPIAGVGSPSLDHEKAPTPAAKTIPVAVTPPLDLYLQIGAFTEQQNAERLSNRLAEHLPKSIRIREAATGDKSIYRVQVGPIANVELADQLAATLVGLGIDDHHFVSN